MDKKIANSYYKNWEVAYLFVMMKNIRDKQTVFES